MCLYLISIKTIQKKLNAYESCAFTVGPLIKFGLVRLKVRSDVTVVRVVEVGLSLGDNKAIRINREFYLFRTFKYVSLSMAKFHFITRLRQKNARCWISPVLCISYSCIIFLCVCFWREDIIPVCAIIFEREQGTLARSGRATTSSGIHFGSLGHFGWKWLHFYYSCLCLESGQGFIRKTSQA